MVKKMQCYTIINVVTSDKEAVYDVEDFALDVPIPSTGWLRMGENCSYYPIKPKDKVNIFINAGKDRMKFNARVVRTHGKRLWFSSGIREQYKKLAKHSKI